MADSEQAPEQVQANNTDGNISEDAENQSPAVEIVPKEIIGKCGHTQYTRFSSLSLSLFLSHQSLLSGHRFCRPHRFFFLFRHIHFSGPRESTKLVSHEKCTEKCLIVSKRTESKRIYYGGRAFSQTAKETRREIESKERKTSAETVFTQKIKWKPTTRAKNNDAISIQFCLVHSKWTHKTNANHTTYMHTRTHKQQLHQPFWNWMANFFRCFFKMCAWDLVFRCEFWLKTWCIPRISFLYI